MPYYLHVLTKFSQSWSHSYSVVVTVNDPAFDFIQVHTVHHVVLKCESSWIETGDEIIRPERTRTAIKSISSKRYAG